MTVATFERWPVPERGWPKLREFLGAFERTGLRPMADHCVYVRFEDDQGDQGDPVGLCPHGALYWAEHGEMPLRGRQGIRMWLCDWFEGRGGDAFDRGLYQGWRCHPDYWEGLSPNYWRTWPTNHARFIGVRMGLRLREVLL